VRFRALPGDGEGGRDRDRARTSGAARTRPHLDHFPGYNSTYKSSIKLLSARYGAVDTVYISSATAPSAGMRGARLQYPVAMVHYHLLRMTVP
jgi:hypothetical protein